MPLVGHRLCSLWGSIDSVSDKVSLAVIGVKVY